MSLGRELENLEVLDSDVLITADIEHFFMTGSSHELAIAASEIVPDFSLRIKIKRAITFLLENQYVKSRDETMYKVNKGSGMGLAHSGSISEAAFLTKAELSVCRNDVLNFYNVRAYFRFKDDCLIIAGTRTCHGST